jgi:hypothetical protein
MAPKNAILDRARKQIEQQLKQAEDDRRKVLIKKRLEFITNGINAVAQKKYAEAVVNFQSYIKLLEEWKGVAEGTLAPNHFDYTKEMGDLLMLSGLYWDLAKIFDRTESQEKLRLFHHYLEKFILFSKGTHWAPMCTEQLRRYLLTNRPKHRQDFKNAFKLMGGSEKCFIVTALSDETDFETIPTLRRFRDEILCQNTVGKQLVRLYYKAGPLIAESTYRLPAFMRKRLAEGFDGLARLIRTRMPER